jgi:hypothetical protein
MADADLIRKWRRIRDPKKALEQIVEHQEFFGYDPYYGDLHRELLAMAARCVQQGTTKSPAKNRLGRS